MRWFLVGIEESAGGGILGFILSAVLLIFVVYLLGGFFFALLPYVIVEILIASIITAFALKNSSVSEDVTEVRVLIVSTTFASVINCLVIRAAIEEPVDFATVLLCIFAGWIIGRISVWIGGKIEAGILDRKAK